MSSTSNRFELLNDTMEVDQGSNSSPVLSETDFPLLGKSAQSTCSAAMSEEAGTAEGDVRHNVTRPGNTAVPKAPKSKGKNKGSSAKGQNKGGVANQPSVLPFVTTSAAEKRKRRDDTPPLS